MKEVMQTIICNIRPATEEDMEKLPAYSYSRIDTFRQCQYRFYLKYRKEIISEERAVALDVGTFCHEILEDRGNSIIKNEKLLTASEVKENKKEEYEILKNTFSSEWNKTDKTGRDYNDKFKEFWSMYDSEMTDPEWHVEACEKEFNIVLGEKYILHGFIDRIDKNDQGDYKVIDYKTAAKIYTEKERDESMQMFIYALAIYIMYGRFPKEFEYDFVFFGEKRPALQSGDNSMEACFTELVNLFRSIEKKDDNKNFIPKRTPLCWWCPYGKNNLYHDAGTCQFYSEWTPSHRTFENHKNILEPVFNADIESERKPLVW